MLQVRTEKHDYKWDEEQYGEYFWSMNRASDESDIDIDHAPVKRAYLSKRLRYRAKIDELRKSGVGVEYLIMQRETAQYEARKKDNWDQDIFDTEYEPLKLEKNHKHLKLQVH